MQKTPPNVHFIQKAIRGDTYTVLADSALEPEDEFTDLYWSQSSSQNVILTPPYEPKRLHRLSSQNNVLNQCIEAMEVNIDGTGYDFVPAEGLDASAINEAEKKLVTSFFNEPIPGKTFLQIRRRLRRDMESTGYGFLEVLRNVKGDVVGFRNIDSHAIRFVKLDAPVMVAKTITRGGTDIEIKMLDRERRFVQNVQSSSYGLHYYREFGTTRHCSRITGEWESETNVIDQNNRATELIVFNVNPDVMSPYGIPRWINQLPSVLGSRKAEEDNLEFLDSGGMPPAIIFVQGGVLAGTAADQLNHYLTGQLKNRNRAVVVEVQSSSGTLDATGSVQVKVERFGSERANDALYQSFDKNAEEHVRIGFRLPPLFIGRSNDYSFATAVVSYMVAEAQVFQPEREEFDSIINKTLLKALGIKTVVLKSRPVSLKTIENKIQALQLVADKVDGSEFVAEVNKLADTKLVFKEAAPAQPEAQQPPQTQDEKPQNAPVGKEPEQVDSPNVAKQVSTLKLAHDWAVANGLIVAKRELEDSEKKEILLKVENLSLEEQPLFFKAVSTLALSAPNPSFTDLVGAHGHSHIS